MNIHYFSNPQEYAKKAADAIEKAIRQRLAERKILRVALSGGKSPIAVYRELAKRPLPWSRITLFLVDERYVPMNAKDSNAGMIQRELIDGVKNLRRFYPYNTRDEITTIVDQYEKTLRQFTDKPLFDLICLGLGEDGHTASLFPHDPALHENSRWVVHTIQPALRIVRGSDGPGQNAQDRLTLTFPALLDSAKIIFLVQGAAKKTVVQKWLEGSPSLDELPAKGVLEHGEVEVFFDESL